MESTREDKFNIQPEVGSPPSAAAGMTLTFCNNMKILFVAIVALTVLTSCDKQAKNEFVSNGDTDGAKPERSMIRSIDVNIGKERIGIELNGERARLRINPYSKEREQFEISYREGLALLEQFYRITNVEEHRGKSSDKRYESTQYIVNLTITIL